jgi:hypothetical protein
MTASLETIDLSLSNHCTERFAAITILFMYCNDSPQFTAAVIGVSSDPFKEAFIGIVIKRDMFSTSPRNYVTVFQFTWNIFQLQVENPSNGFDRHLSVKFIRHQSMQTSKDRRSGVHEIAGS